MKKHSSRKILVMALALLFPIAGSQAVPASAAVKITPMEAAARTVSPTAVRVSWKAKKGVVKWKVQVAAEKHYNAGTFRTAAALKGKSTAFTVKGLKKDHAYYFRVIGYTEKDGKLVKTYRTYRNDVPGYAGVAVPLWDDYAHADAYCSAKRIDLWLNGNADGLQPDGFQIWRKEEGKPDCSYRKIAQFRASALGTIRDKKVKAGKTYLYRARGYKVIKGRKVYSVWSDTLRRSAVRQHGIFSAEKVSASADGRTLVVKLTSEKKYNADLVLADRGLDVFTREQAADWEESLPLRLVSCSSDNRSWKKLSAYKNGVPLKGGKSIYLKFTGESGAESAYSIGSAWVTYNRLPSILEITLGSSGKTDNNGEAIH